MQFRDKSNQRTVKIRGEKLVGSFSTFEAVSGEQTRLAKRREKITVVG